eukprot:CAMPEP_0172699028 /NCGR_PEP_ID=MMETSP1074-20121228/29883_1 /TAXON_ID=2916 /ORGANISM="Ceratium fusus, Strain PA161109" /LENGTH=527 /DNA_ID=CAMNT_0013520165 /DNA_START=69 /DNA_END=1653 /DNA_ORIENTATION=+
MPQPPQLPHCGASAECEKVCSGVALTPLCDEDPLKGREPRDPLSQYESCHMCRARSHVWTPPSSKPFFEPYAKNSSMASPGELFLDTQRHTESQRLPNAAYSLLAPEPSGIVPKSIIPSARIADANFYSMADGACLHHWEFGVLVGYGFAAVFAAGSIPAGFVCDRRPRVAVASAALMIWSFGTSLQASAHDFSFLLGCRAIVGLAQAFAMPAATSLAADYFVDRPGIVVVVLSVGLYLGSGCASFSLLLAGLVGWRWVTLFVGLFGMVLSLVFYSTVQEPERTEWSAPCSISVVSDEVFEKSRVAWMIIVAGSAKMLAAYSLGAFLPIWYSRSDLDGYTSTEYAYTNALAISAGGLLSALLGSLLSLCWGRRDPRAPCWIGLVGAILSLPLICMVLLTPSFTMSMTALFLLLLVSESWFGPAVALLQASVRRSVRGQAVSMFLVASSLAANFGPVVVGILDTGGPEVGLHLLWLCLAANLAAASAFVWTAREIGIDPVAAGLGSRPADLYQETTGAKAGMAHWVPF